MPAPAPHCPWRLPGRRLTVLQSHARRTCQPGIGLCTTGRNSSTQKRAPLIPDLRGERTTEQGPAAGTAKAALQRGRQKRRANAPGPTLNGRQVGADAGRERAGEAGHARGARSPRPHGLGGALGQATSTANDKGRGRRKPCPVLPAVAAVEVAAAAHRPRDRNPLRYTPATAAGLHPARCADAASPETQTARRPDALLAAAGHARGPGDAAVPNRRHHRAQQAVPPTERFRGGTGAAGPAAAARADATQVREHASMQEHTRGCTRAHARMSANASTRAHTAAHGARTGTRTHPHTHTAARAWPRACGPRTSPRPAAAARPPSPAASAPPSAAPAPAASASPAAAS